MHELGHGMHQLTSRTTYWRFHGPLGTPPDFFEAPSQMMENWAFEPAILKKFSKHWSYLSDEYKIAWQKAQDDSNAVQPPEKMPDELIKDIRRIRNAYAVNEELRQVFIADYDLKLHELKTHEDAAKLDTTELYNVGYKNFSGLDGPEVLGEGFHWGHGVSNIMCSADCGVFTFADYGRFRSKPNSDISWARMKGTITAIIGAESMLKTGSISRSRRILLVVKQDISFGRRSWNLEGRRTLRRSLWIFSGVSLVIRLIMMILSWMV